MGLALVYAWRTYARAIYLIRNCDPELLVFGRVLAANKDLDGESAALELLEMLGYRKRVSFSPGQQFLATALALPFFAVVRT